MKEVRVVELAARAYRNMEKEGNEFLEDKEGGRVLGVDLETESRRHMGWDIWKRSRAAVSWEDTEEGRRKREPPAWP